MKESKAKSIYERVQEVNHLYAQRKREIVEGSSIKGLLCEEGKFILAPLEETEKLINDLEKLRIYHIQTNIPEAIDLMDDKFTGIKSGFIRN